jgi:uncharacterized protein related to proFAR isomerase
LTLPFDANCDLSNSSTDNKETRFLSLATGLLGLQAEVVEAAAVVVVADLDRMVDSGDNLEAARNLLVVVVAADIQAVDSLMHMVEGPKLVHLLRSLYERN